MQNRRDNRRNRAGWWIISLLILFFVALIVLLLRPTQPNNPPIPTTAPTLLVMLPSPTVSPTDTPSPTPTETVLPPSPTAIPPSPQPTQIPATATLPIPPQPDAVEIALGGGAVWGEGVPPIYGRFGGLYDNPKWVNAGHVFITVPATENLPSFYIDTFEVTNLQFQHFLNATQLTDLPLFEGEWISSEGNLQQNNTGFWEIKPANTGALPVRGISAWAARAYCVNLGGNLPTLAQWQIATFWDGGTTLRTYPWGEALPDHNRVHFESELPLRVNSLEGGRSWVGAYQLVGNVAEWLQADDRPLGFIGGSFADDSLSLIEGLQQVSYTDQPQVNVGFRCVLLDEN